MNPPATTTTRITSNRPLLSLWTGLTIAILLETLVQILWKLSTRQIAQPGNMPTAPLASLLQLLQTPLFQFLILLWIAQFINWLLVLARSDLSFAQPMSAISYITVAASAYFIFHETLSPLRALGIALIVIGAWQMGATTPKTTQPPQVPPQQTPQQQIPPGQSPS